MKKVEVIVIDDFETINKDIDEKIKKSIKQKIEILKITPHRGVHIAKRKIPNQYLSKYGVTNLWKINLSNAWRMIYTIKTDDMTETVLIIDILDHKSYSKKFGYKP